VNNELGIASAVETAVTAIRKATQLVGDTDSGIDHAQIADLRAAIDELELILNEKKRGLNSVRGSSTMILAGVSSPSSSPS
jgi:hypothetical protein